MSKELKKKESLNEILAAQKADFYVISISLIVLVGVILWAIIAPDHMATTVNGLLRFATYDFGWLILSFGFVSFAFVLYMAFGPYGHIKMGKDEDKPVHGYFAWACMIIACGYAAGLVYWGAAEPLTFFQSPPPGIEPMSIAAAERAIAQSFFHWGWTPWAIYMAAGIPIGYLIHRKGFSLNFGAMLSPIFGERAHSKGFKLVDGFVAFGIIGGVMTSCGLGILQLCGGLESLFGIPRTNSLILTIIVIWTVIYTYSAISGIDKGIKRLSNANIILCMAICAVVFICGDWAFIMNTTSTGFGIMLNEFFTMSFSTDSIGQGGFAQDWTAFYWAWFIAGAIPTGIFAASVSKGRTIKEFVTMHLLCIPILTWMWFGTFGSTAIKAQMDGLDLVGKMNELGTSSAVFSVLDTLPSTIGLVTKVLFLVLILVFLVTTVDSYSYSLAQLSYRGNGLIPPKLLRSFWALVISTFTAALIIIGEGQMQMIQTSSIVAAAIIAVFMVFLIAGMFKLLRQETRKK